MIASLQPALFIGYFWQQPTGPSQPSDSNLSAGQTTLVDAARLVGVAAFLILGVSLFGEGIKAIHPSPEAIHLTRVFEAHTFINRRGDTLSYRLLKPESYDSTQRYPLLICLHGGAGYGTDNIRQLASWEIQQLTRPENRKKYPAFILAPQCPRGSSWGGLPHLIARDTIVFDVLSTLEKEFRIDPDRRYVAGHSLGGYGTWYFIGTRPGVFAAALPLCGAGDPALARNMVDVAVWALHGKKTRTCRLPVHGM
ncbi:alpha/beta hydrolase-fold protein [Larkinella insperata]|uniref:Alpha/beta hydrolase-fold protein n=1 Tax=Larkinella insperata TaxID=332158 RepID=A0ABW3Q229_9BACT